MKSFLKKLLLNVADAAKDTAMGMIPGSDLVIKGIAALLDKDDHNNVEAIDNLQNGIMVAVQSLGPAQVENASMIMAGVADLKAGFDKIKAGLKK